MSYLADVAVVGGDGGNPFDFNGAENGATLKKIWVWVGDWQVKAMKVWLTDGQSMQFGQPLGNFTEFIFEDTERFTSLSLWASGNDSRLAAIKFKTNRSREFSARLTSTFINSEIPIDVASGICMGIKGRSGSDIDCLGFAFVNTIKSCELTDVVYPTLTDTTPKVSVNEIKSIYQNNSTETQEYRIETSKTINQTSSWSVKDKLELMINLEVTAGIPQLVDAKTNFKLKPGVESTYASATSEERMEHVSLPVKVPPGKTVNVDITIGKATIDLPFNGIIKITCDNGGVLRFTTSGTYKGVTYSGRKVVVNQTDNN